MKERFELGGELTDGVASWVEEKVGKLDSVLPPTMSRRLLSTSTDLKEESQLRSLQKTL